MNFFVADIAASPGGERRAALSGGRCWNVVEPGTEKVGWGQRSKRREERKQGASLPLPLWVDCGGSEINQELLSL